MCVRHSRQTRWACEHAFFFFCLRETFVLFFLGRGDCDRDLGERDRPACRGDSVLIRNQVHCTICNNLYTYLIVSLLVAITVQLSMVMFIHVAPHVALRGRVLIDRGLRGRVFVNFKKHFLTGRGLAQVTTSSIPPKYFPCSPISAFYTCKKQGGETKSNNLCDKGTM